jgi:hypothetical protein
MFSLFPLSPPWGEEGGRREAEAARGGDTRRSYGPRGPDRENGGNEVGAGVLNPRRTGLGGRWGRSFCRENDREHGGERLGALVSLCRVPAPYFTLPSARVLLVSGARVVMRRIEIYSCV